MVTRFWCDEVECNELVVTTPATGNHFSVSSRILKIIVGTRETHHCRRSLTVWDRQRNRSVPEHCSMRCVLSISLSRSLSLLCDALLWRNLQVVVCAHCIFSLAGDAQNLWVTLTTCDLLLEIWISASGTVQYLRISSKISWKIIKWSAHWNV